MKRFRNILVDIGTGRSPGPALQRATTLARQNDATMTVVAVAPELRRTARLFVPAGVQEILAGEQEERLAHTLAELQAAGLHAASKMLTGEHAVELIREALRGGHDLLLRSHLATAPYGPIDVKLLRKCPCPVWLVAGPTAGPYTTILAAVKPSPDDDSMSMLNRHVLELATSLASSEGGTLLVVHGWSLFGESTLRGRLKEEELSELLDQTRNAARRDVEAILAPFAGQIPDEHVHFVKGLSGDVIPEFVAAHDVGLLVMGTRGRSGVGGMVIGNTAERVLGEVRCSFIALKPAGFVSPITL
jgi:nucleotide-binding universal stress UspA family protein